MYRVMCRFNSVKEDEDFMRSLGFRYQDFYGYSEINGEMGYPFEMFCCTHTIDSPINSVAGRVHTTEDWALELRAFRNITVEVADVTGRN